MKGARKTSILVALLRTFQHLKAISNANANAYTLALVRQKREKKIATHTLARNTAARERVQERMSEGERETEKADKRRKDKSAMLQKVIQSTGE